MSSSTNYIGIDISKLDFDVALRRGNGQYRSYKFKNTPDGFRKFKELLDTDSWCVMEASGPYYLRLATYLSSQGFNVSVVNPLVIRRFCQMRLMRAKTDKKDAQMIADYGKMNNPGLWAAEAGYVLELKQMQAYVEQLNKQRTSFIRQQEAFKQGTVFNKDVSVGLKRFILKIEGEIKKIESKMVSIIELHHKEMFDKLNSIPGLGKKTSMLLIVLTGGFTKFDNAKQVSSYFGLSPRIFESGTSIKGRAKICKMGMSKIRAMLYICSWTAKKYNRACKALYDRLVEKGKSRKLALIAVANKLIKQAFALATKNQTYDPNYYII